MNINKSTYNLFSYGSLVVIAILLVLIYTRVTPPAMNYYLLIFAILLITARLFVRIFYMKNIKNNNNTGG